MKAQGGRDKELRGKSSKQPTTKNRLGTKMNNAEPHEELEDGPSRKLKDEEEVDKRPQAELDCVRCGAGSGHAKVQQREAALFGLPRPCCRNCGGGGKPLQKELTFIRQAGV